MMCEFQQDSQQGHPFWARVCDPFMGKVEDGGIDIQKSMWESKTLLQIVPKIIMSRLAHNPGGFNCSDVIELCSEICPDGIFSKWLDHDREGCSSVTQMGWSGVPLFNGVRTFIPILQMRK